MNDKLTSYPAQREAFFYDIIETSPGQGGKHHYIVQIDNPAKICEVFSSANKELVLKALNTQQHSQAMTRELVEALTYCENMAINGMASHRDAIVGRCQTAINRANLFLGDKE